jgi:superfamily II DNA/RNA helicase
MWPKHEDYMLRIGRAGRFYDSGIALTILDHDWESRAFQEIVQTV